MIHEKLRMKRAFLERSKWPYILYIFSQMKLLALFLPNDIQADREIENRKILHLVLVRLAKLEPLCRFSNVISGS